MKDYRTSGGLLTEQESNARIDLTVAQWVEEMERERISAKKHKAVDQRTSAKRLLFVPAH